MIVNGGVLFAPGTFSQSFTLTRNVETLPVQTSLSLGVAPFFDGGARVRVTRTLSIGAVGFLSASKADGSLDAQVPHPFYFNQPRAIGGTLSRLDHSERGVHVELAYPISVARGREITVFGGPSFVHVQQALVTDLAYTESYPFDTATFSNATTGAVTANAFGANVGADVTWRLGRSVRAGALVRYTFANPTLTAAPGNSVSMHAGGYQVGGGLRMLIQKGPPRAPRQPRPARPARPRR